MPDPMFIKGEKISVKDDTGVVNFIDDKYITITTNQWEDCITCNHLDKLISLFVYQVIDKQTY